VAFCAPVIKSRGASCLATHVTIIGPQGFRVPTFFAKSFPQICKITQPLETRLLQHHAANQFAGSCSHPAAGFRSTVQPVNLQGDTATSNSVEERDSSRFVAITSLETNQPAST
jgi:hypothetical protein